MKSIKLTKKHKQKLLKMCKKLFLEYNKKYSLKNFEEAGKGFYEEYNPQKPIWSIDNNGHIYLQLFYIYGEDRSLEIIDMHWFEFCMTHLARKIYNNENYPRPHIGWDSTDGISTMITDQEWDSKYNPIDYLYKEFLKLKK